MSALSLPVLNLATFDGEVHSPFVTALREAAHGPGFCYLTGHGIDPTLQADLLRHARAFFQLPEAERHAIAIGNSPHFRGYTLLGDEMTAGARDWREQIDIGPEEPPLTLSSDDPPWLKLRGPNQWPAGVPALRTTVTAWLAEMETLAMTVMRALALGLGQPASYFDPVLAPDPYPRVKVIRYPALPDRSATSQGLGLHHDSGLLSFILQDGVGGLQVQSGGQLIDVTPRADAYIMNLGEMLQVATQGYLKATPHRVVSPPQGQERLSIAYFFNPRLDAVIDPVPLPPDLAAQAPGGQNSAPDDPVYRTFGANTLKIRMRAHPDVTQRFYADVDLSGYST